MPIKIEVAKAELSFEAGYASPEFGLFRDGPTLLDALYRRLAPYGLRLGDIRFEQGAGGVADRHFLLYLFNWMTVRLRVDRIEIACAELPQEYLEKYRAAILDVVRAVQDHKSGLSFRAFAVAIVLHATLDGTQVRDYLARFVTNVPRNLGPAVSSGAIFYFGPEGERILSSVTMEVSASVPDALFIRVQGVWDAQRLSLEALGANRVDAFVREALLSLDLQAPA